MNADNTSGLRDALDFVNRQPCRCMSIAQLGERDYCDRCQSVKNLRALLARTEAGADEAVAWLCEWTDEDDGETVRVSFEFKRGAENRALEVGGDARVIPLYTHPQDASGDAERYRWLKSKLLSADFEPDDYVGLTFALPAGSHVSANLDATLDAAMQAKEAK